MPGVIGNANPATVGSSYTVTVQSVDANWNTNIKFVAVAGFTVIAL